GTLRDLLLGVRFVQADGVVTWGGAKVVKSVSGYDVPKLMVGALGTLGVLGELTLRLHPVPEFEATWLASFKDAGAAQAFVARLGADARGVATITGSATLGGLRAAFPAMDLHAMRTIVERLRALVAPWAGSVIIQRAPAAIRAAVDPWGPVEPGAFALMRGL